MKRILTVTVLFLSLIVVADSFSLNKTEDSLNIVALKSTPYVVDPGY
ncbi:hypothetical protein C2W64_00252 [Brevibacillus laterosporus]|nr:hypothetical protein [Brevibacillus laterosporus]RAP31080.1 hypothetical protein C2W64_00252 [Brevibacillus laterosporus]